MNPVNSAFGHAALRQGSFHANPFPVPGARRQRERHYLPAGLATGFRALDTVLGHGGWPPGGCIEVLSDSCGLGPLGLFLPAMAALSARDRWQAFIAPPHTPYRALLEARGIDTGRVLQVHPRNREAQLWSTEQALRKGTCSIVFSWLGAGNYHYRELRRLQAAAVEGNCLAVLFRANAAAGAITPSDLRLKMRAYRTLHILQQREGSQGLDVYLSPAEDNPQHPQLWELPTNEQAGLSGAPQASAVRTRPVAGTA
ncbi:translesion DNA synthesis-associated protein ImuA [Parahaliea mediterranea]|uniref:Translesion DNA synthesis-associated protein ImuA n=1 Tax=Parahaliea mediterranea TaxID=651086 RepID=A0A939DD57_9GAMM|nr:translesion DNA synthesis-associated protein ImuA [Parahaliea mediterranea]MBN7795731.1 translesion DNA synthesis-associated protein ImuA [Parahaliea mediterranea]